MDTIYQQTLSAATELLEKARLQPGQILVVGCSTSEVLGERIGTYSSPQVAEAIFDALFEATKNAGIHLAVQCCEHLNRAIVVSRTALPNAEPVNVRPMPKAGGSLATLAYAGLPDAIVVEHIRADAGLDIGFTLIGMHLKEVAVPLRLQNNRIGEALLVAARTRPKFIGGIRAVYNEDLL